MRKKTGLAREKATARRPVVAYRVRWDCAEADAVARHAMEEGVDPPPAQLERLREAVCGHLRELVAVVDEQYADAPAGPWREVITKTLGVASDILAQPIRGSALDLLVPPPAVRLLLLMHTEPIMFGAHGQAMMVRGEDEADAV
ncbi:MAG TPA: hypothetical protein VN520_17240 [Streptomyces sp.]|uniref:hypothetical protein n=1 Tax=Streptomyces sp. TaxID=1931 RepID=UPI002D10A3F3|nr:hypothetical protein [Streptomyces sp.]HWU08101.1 hypothetical protein [Streptomyces sp.]